MSYVIKVLNIDDFGTGEEGTDFLAVSHNVTDLVFEQHKDKVTCRPAGPLRLEIETEDDGVVVFPDLSKIVYVLSKEWKDHQKAAHEDMLASQDKAKVVDIGGPTK